MKQFHKEWWEWSHRRHFEGGWRKWLQNTQKSPGGPARQGLLLFLSFVPSSQRLSSHQTTLKQVAEKEGRKWQCLLRVSRSPGCFVRASCSPSLLEPVTLQRGTTLLPGTARACLLLSCVMSKQAAGCWGAALFSLPNQFKPNLSSLLSVQWCSCSCLWSRGLLHKNNQGHTFRYFRVLAPSALCGSIPVSFPGQFSSH